MVEQYLRQHALAHRGIEAAADTASEAAVRLWLEPASIQLCLRGQGDEAFLQAVASVLGVAPPTAPNTVATTGARRVLWLGPDEWLAVCGDEEDAPALCAALEKALDGMHALVSDVSHSRVVFALEGAAARDMLRKGCSLDLDRVAFASDRCAQTGLARAHMLLHQVSDVPRYHVYIHRSFADYAFAWLLDAGREYSVALTGS